MDPHVSLVVAACVVGLSPFAWTMLRRPTDGSRRFGPPHLLSLTGAALILVTADVLWPPQQPVVPPGAGPRVVHEDGFVGSGACASCHPHQHATWHASYHRTMTQWADPQAILAPFDGSELQLEGATWRVEQRGDEFWVVGRPTDTGGAPPADLEVEARVAMATGSHNYQLYWVESDTGALQQFPLVYLLQDKLWIPRKSRFLRPPLEWTPNEADRWKSHCIKCHATRGRKEVLPDGETRVAELGIACEACHGPGLEHVERNRMPFRRYRLHLTGEADPTIVNPRRLPHDRATEVCGQCHSIEIFLDGDKASDWAHEGTRYRPGARLAEFQTTVVGRYADNPPEVRRYLDQNPVFRLRNCFWPDGMLRVGGREYHGTLDSPCYRRGNMSCLSCHTMHLSADDPRTKHEWAEDQLGTGMAGDRACLQCHEKYAGAVAVAAHSHHAADSTGSRCYNCHMPYTTWGLLRGIRSHTVDSPSVATSVATGRPNACNQCHLDRTLQWTAETLATWYGAALPDLSDDERTVAASILWTLRGNAVQRALMAWSMGWEPAGQISGTSWTVPYLSLLLLDPYDAVRYSAQRTLRGFPEYATAAAAAGVAGSTKEEQAAIMAAILDAWNLDFARSEGKAGPQLLIHPGGEMDLERLRRLASRRDDQGLVLFE